MPGPKSKLTDDQWIEIERLHFVEGQSVNSLAKKYGVSEKLIRVRIKKNDPNCPNSPKSKNRVKPGESIEDIAKKKLEADRLQREVSDKIAALPYAKQETVAAIVKKLSNVSDHLVSGAEYGAANFHRLSAIAHEQLQKVDDANPLDHDSVMALQTVAALMKTANLSAETALNLLRANKDTVTQINEEAMQKLRQEQKRTKTTDPVEASRTYQQIMSGS
jgi:hypothetical protein